MCKDCQLKARPNKTCVYICCKKYTQEAATKETLTYVLPGVPTIMCKTLI